MGYSYYTYNHVAPWQGQERTIRRCEHQTDHIYRKQGRKVRIHREDLL